MCRLVGELTAHSFKTIQRIYTYYRFSKMVGQFEEDIQYNRDFVTLCFIYLLSKVSQVT